MLTIWCTINGGTDAFALRDARANDEKLDGPGVVFPEFRAERCFSRGAHPYLIGWHFDRFRAARRRLRTMLASDPACDVPHVRALHGDDSDDGNPRSLLETWAS